MDGGEGGGEGKGGRSSEQRAAGAASAIRWVRPHQKTEQWSVGWVSKHPIVPLTVSETPTRRRPARPQRVLRGQSSRRKVPAGRRACPVTKGSGGTHRHRRMEVAADHSDHGHPHRISAARMRKVSGLQLGRSLQSRDAPRTVHRAGDGETNAAHQPSRASCGRAGWSRHLEARPGCSVGRDGRAAPHERQTRQS